MFRGALFRLLHRLERALARTPLELALAMSALFVAVYAVSAPLFAARYPAMTDLPFHAAQTSTLRHYFDPAFHQREQFEIHPIAVPYLSMYAVGAALMLVLPMLTAIKIASALMLFLLPAGLAVMFHGMKKSPLLGLLGLGLAWCNLTHWGFLNFVGALGLFAMAIGFTMLLVDRPTRGRSIGLALTLVALFFTHIFRFPFALCAVVGTAIVMYPSTRRFRPILAPMLPSLFFFGWWLWVRPSALGGDFGSFHPQTQRLGEIEGLIVGAFYDKGEKEAFIRFARTALWVGGISLVAFFVRALEGKARRWTWEAGVVFVPVACGLVFLFLFLVLPMQIGIWWYVYPREATAAAFMALGLFPDLPRAFWLRAPLVVALSAAGLGITKVVSKHYKAFDGPTADFYTITRQIPQAPKLLYLIYDHGGCTRTTTPFIHLPAYVQAEKGGWLSFHFAIWGASPIVYRSPDEPGAVVPPPVPNRWEWQPHLFTTKRGEFFDWFLIRKQSSPDGLFRTDPSIERVDHVGEWWLYRRSSNPVRFTEP